MAIVRVFLKIVGVGFSKNSSLEIMKRLLLFFPVLGNFMPCRVLWVVAYKTALPL